MELSAKSLPSLICFSTQQHLTVDTAINYQQLIYQEAYR